MEITPSRSWYKKKRFVIPGIVIGSLLVLSSIGGATTSPSYTQAAPEAIPASNTGTQLVGTSGSNNDSYLPTDNARGFEDASDTGSSSTSDSDITNTDFNSSSDSDAIAEPEDTSANATSSVLSNDDHYVNTYGDTVHSPAYSSDNAAPSGATAQCGDGTYSFSESHRGTCSHHSGVSSWL